jgi:hypothetical protein
MLAIIVFNLASYAGLFNPLPVPTQSQLTLPGLPEQSTQLLQQPPATGANLPLQRLIAAFIPILAIAIVDAILTAWLLTRRHQKMRRDAKRLQDLTALAQTFEQYFNRHGHYPVSATYDPQYYSAINILSEWASYNFPPAEEMTALNPSWPLCDPNLTPASHDQAGNYLYYPHHFGQRFSLYARLESPKQQPVPDYNVIDQLPPTAVIYNYRFNGPDHHVEAANQPAGTVSPAAPAAVPSQPRPATTPSAAPATKPA